MYAHYNGFSGSHSTSAASNPRPETPPPAYSQEDYELSGPYFPPGPQSYDPYPYEKSSHEADPWSVPTTQAAYDQDVAAHHQQLLLNSQIEKLAIAQTVAQIQPLSHASWVDSSNLHVEKPPALPPRSHNASPQSFLKPPPCLRPSASEADSLRKIFHENPPPLPPRSPNTFPQESTASSIPESEALLSVYDPKAPALPPRPHSALSRPLRTSSAPPATLESASSSSEDVTKVKDKKGQAGKARRFLGDSLVGRFVRASTQTATATMNRRITLSPWGDNNPVTLPNVRYRDAIIFTSSTVLGGPLIDGLDSGLDSVASSIFGADSFVFDVVNSGTDALMDSFLLQNAMLTAIEETVERCVFEPLALEEERAIVTTSIATAQVAVKHKFMGVDAEIDFWGIYPARDQKACEKGWFCPYLFATARTPFIPRIDDFAIAQLFQPPLEADSILAQRLVGNCAHVMDLRRSSPNSELGADRLVVLFTAITPFRGGNGMWSTSRRPGCGIVHFHVPDGCPALVLPVTADCPILAWSPWTLAQMQASRFNGAPGSVYRYGPKSNADAQGLSGDGYDPSIQHWQICNWLESVVSWDHVEPGIRNRFAEVLGRCISLVVNGALGLSLADKKLVKKLDPERAGIAMFRY